MKEILYLEIPTPDIAAVRNWLQADFQPGHGVKILTPDGFRLNILITIQRREQQFPKIY